jgi:hypothetical protein
MALVMAFVLAAQVRTELSACDEVVDTTFQHLVALEWSDAPGTVTVRVECDGARATVRFSGPAAERVEPVTLPGLSKTARARLLAVIIGERGRAWLEGALEPVRQPLSLSAATERQPEPTTVAPVSVSDFPTALWRIRLGAGLNPWRVGVGAVGSTGSSGPLRFGGGIRGSLGVATLAAAVMTTSSTVSEGLVSVTHGALGAGVTLLSIEGTVWQVRTAARLVGGYGSASATPHAEFTATRVETFLFGGEAEVSFVIAPVSAAYFELALAGGWTSGVLATIDGKPFASLGGWSAGLSLSVGTSWR